MPESQPYPALPHQRHSEAPEVLPAMFDQQYPLPSSLFWCQCNRTHSGRVLLTAVAAELLRSKRRRRCFVIEPGYTFQSITRTPCSLTGKSGRPKERPFLMVIQPCSGRAWWDEPFSRSHTTCLVPAFRGRKGAIV